jgi:DNA processing protein
MNRVQESAALIALLRQGQRTPQAYADLVEEARSALDVLERELSGDHDQISLLPPAGEVLLAEAMAEIAGWRDRGIRLLTLLDPDYPENLRAVHDRPPVIFVAGELGPGDARSVAVIGSRRASPAGINTARRTAERLAGAGYVITSGLATGVDTAAHTAALEAGGRTLAVIGTGLNHAYPPRNAELQRRLGRECAVISRFWPDQPPSRQGFPLRNATMSGLTLGTVIVEASPTSGTRIQARQALAHGRPVFLMSPTESQPWARELAARPGVYVVDSPEQVISTIERLHGPGALVG